MNDIKEALLDGATILDVRNDDEFKEAHYNGAKLIPLAELESRYTELDKSKTVVIYCKMGGRAGRAKTFLESKGFKALNAGGLSDISAIKLK